MVRERGAIEMVSSMHLSTCRPFRERKSYHFQRMDGEGIAFNEGAAVVSFCFMFQLDGGSSQSDRSGVELGGGGEERVSPTSTKICFCTRHVEQTK